MDGSSDKRWLKVAGLLGAAAVAAYAAPKLFALLGKKHDRAPLDERAAAAIDRTWGWHRIPWPLGLLTLVGLRRTLRRENLHDTGTPQAASPAVSPTWEERYRRFRSADGTYNDLTEPRMGSVGTRFGRNVPLEDTQPTAVLDPSPREVSRKLMTRHQFQPATSINLLVAAWIQFMVRDWLSHGPSPKENPWEIPLADGDPWPENPMRILRERPDPTRTDAEKHLPPTYVNTETHWWDGSQIYGSSLEFQHHVRTLSEGKLKTDFVILADDKFPSPPTVAGWWVGLSLMFTLFILEHNAICDHLRAAYPSWSDEELFEHARLINIALIAKIHTVEWTPAIIAHPATEAALNANWWGVAGEQIHRLFGRISTSEVISGIPGSKTDHFGTPYALTEEFAAVYRLHPLIPDVLTFRSADDDAEITTRTFQEVAGPGATDLSRQISMSDLLYSFGRMHPGAVRLHNYPVSLQQFTRPDGVVIDLAAHDILRTRELGVPRYNQFRRRLHLAPAETFEQLTDVPAWQEEIRSLYQGDVEAVDLITGMFAEPLPQGFGFSDTAFRIFILMASRRLNSDRFFTTHFTPEVYTPEGMDWVQRNRMSSVLLRHYPKLTPALRGIDNPFKPWSSVKA